MPKVISIPSRIVLFLVINHFNSESHFEKDCGIKRIGTRVLTKKGEQYQVILYNVIDKKKLSYAKIKYEF